MEKLFQQYDAHVKAHQRFLLLKLMDEAKSEAMAQLLAQKTPLPEERVVVPRPETELPLLAFEAAVDTNDFRFFTPRDIPAPAAAVVPALMPDMALFEGIAPCAVQPEAVTLATEAVIDSEIFSGIPNGKTVLPTPAHPYEPDVSAVDGSELLPSVSVPDAAFSYQPIIDEAVVAVSIPALDVAPVELPEVTSVALAFHNVTLPQVNLQNVNLSQQVDLTVSPQAASVALPHVETGAVSILKTSIAPKSFDDIPLSAAIHLPMPTRLTDVMTVPQQTAVSVPSVSVSAMVLPNPHVTLPSVEVPKPAVSSVSLPDLHFEPYTTMMPSVSIPSMQEVLDTLGREQLQMIE